MAAAIFQIRRGTNDSTGSIAFSESELFYNQSKETLQIANGSNSLVTLARLDRINTGSLQITGDFTASNAFFSGDITFGGSLITLGNENTDNIVIGGELSSSIIPNNDNAFDLGSNTRRYKSIYATSGSISNINGVDFTTFVNTTNTFTSSIDTTIKTKLNVEGVISGSSQVSYVGLSNIPAGIVSGSSQVSYVGLSNIPAGIVSGSTQVKNLLPNGSVSGSSQVSYVGLSNIPASIVSGSSQVSYVGLSNIPAGIVSGSSQISASLTTNFATDVKTQLNNNAVVSGSTQITNGSGLLSSSVTNFSTYTSSIDSKFNTLGTYTASIDSKFTTLGTYTASVDTKFSTLATYTASVNADLTNLHNYTASVDTKFTTLGTYTSSIDSKFSTLSSYTSSIDSKFVAVGISTASLNTYTASQDSKNSALATYTASVNADLTNLHTYTASINSDLTNLHTYTASLKSAIDVTGQNLVVYGDLTVQGNTTTLNTTELIVEDKLLALASGSTTPAQADGAGLYISGANASITWNNANSLVNINQKVSSSVGFKGNGSELTGVIAAGVDYTNITNKPTLVSGSSQVTSSLDFRYLMIDGDSVVSGSSQVDLTGTTNYVSGIKTRLNAEGVISGSTQITNGSGLLSSSVTTFNDYSASVVNDLNTLHSFTASQNTKNSALSSYTASVDSKFTTLGSYTSSIDTKFSTLSTYTASVDTKFSTLSSYTSSIDSKFTTLGSYTSSIDTKFSTLSTYTASVNSDLGVIHSYTASNDTKITNLFNTASQYQAFSSSINNTIKTKLNVEGVVSASSDSSTIDFTITNGVITGNVIGGIVSGSSQVTQSLDSRYEASGSVAQLVGIRAVSGSLGSAAWYNVTSSADIVLVSGSINYNNNHLLTAGATKKYIDWRTDEILTAIGAADITSVTTGNDGITGGGTVGAITLSLDTNSSTFTNGVKTKLNVDGVISGSSQVSYLGLSNIPVGIVSGSSQLTASLDNRYELKGTGVISGSSQLTTSFDARYLNTGGDGVISGSSQVSYLGLSNIPVGIVSGSSQVIGILSSLNSFTQSYFTTDSASFDSRLDNLEAYSSSLLVPTASLALRALETDVYVKNQSGAQINKGSVVRVVGATGDNPLIGTASYLDEISSANVLGITTSDIANGAWGYVITSGILVGLNTSLFTAGDLIYLGATGSITNIEPSAPLHTVRLGEVLRVQSVNGSINVRIDNGAELDELHNVIDTSTTASYGDILMKSGSIWYNNSTFSSSIDTKFTTLGTYTASLETKNATLATYTASLETKNATLATYTSSNDTKWSTLGSLSGSFARINTSNTFNGTQTISGSLYVTQDLIVQGSSSIQNISSSNVTIGAAYVTLNTFSPSSRFAGLRIIDSGSAGLSGSFLYDSVDDEFIFVHKGNGTNVTSSHVVMGPETYDNLGNEIYMTTNRIPKVLNYEHIGDSQISDDGTTVTIPGALTVTGNITGPIRATNGVVSGSIQILGGSGIVSSSAQVTPLLPAGTVSGSTQVTKSLQEVTNAGATTSNAISITNSTSSTTSGTGALIVTGGVGIGGSVNVAGDVVAYSSSDRRLKNEITRIENPLQKINAIGGYSFVWNEDTQNTYKGKDYGVIAQEIEAILPELVDNRENGYKAVKYDRLVSLLIEGIKDLSNQVEELKQQINKG